ncbi:MAG: 30S ribosome-binding factor RbfA [Phycisphaerae bacterium]|nr:30S ribosome-binding factor RbfA [Gemmatimonadaceae bacterium]
MAGDSRRSERVAAAIREEVATFLRVGAKDPRLKGFVTVTEVEVTRDLRHANVFVSVRGSDADTKATFEGLNSVAAHLRSLLGKSLALRNAPEVHFKADQSVAYAGRIEELLAQVREETPPAPADEVTEGHAEGDISREPDK